MLDSGPVCSPARWRRWDVNVVLPAATARRMLVRARRWGLRRGGRFDVRRDKRAIVLWSAAQAGGLREQSIPVASIFFRWSGPDERTATIWRIACDEAHGGSLDEVCRAIEVLGGVLGNRPDPNRRQSGTSP